jgi:hypothetical protein
MSLVVWVVTPLSGVAGQRPSLQIGSTNAARAGSWVRLRCDVVNILAKFGMNLLEHI